MYTTQNTSTIQTVLSVVPLTDRMYKSRHVPDEWYSVATPQ